MEDNQTDGLEVVHVVDVNDATVKKMLDSISNHATRSEKTAWERKRKNVEALVSKLEPLEEEILELMTAKLPLIDSIMELRQEMVDVCIHPKDMLVVHEEVVDDGVIQHIRCKFCERKLKAMS